MRKVLEGGAACFLDAVSSGILRFTSNLIFELFETSVVTLIRKPPLVPNAAKTRGGFLIKSPKSPKNFGAFGADFSLFV
mgnify:CR=1 FL=1